MSGWVNIFLATFFVGFFALVAKEPTLFQGSMIYLASMCYLTLQDIRGKL